MKRLVSRPLLFDICDFNVEIQTFESWRKMKKYTVLIDEYFDESPPRKEIVECDRVYVRDDMVWFVVKDEDSSLILEKGSVLIIATRNFVSATELK